MISEFGFRIGPQVIRRCETLNRIWLGPPGFVNAADLSYSAAHIKVASACAFVVTASDWEFSGADIVDKLADQAMDDVMRVVPGGAVIGARGG